MSKKTFKVEAEGDTLYFGASDLDDAKAQFTALMGDVPESLLTWSEEDALPDGEEYAADVR